MNREKYKLKINIILTATFSLIMVTLIFLLYYGLINFGNNELERNISKGILLVIFIGSVAGKNPLVHYLVDKKFPDYYDE